MQYRAFGIEIASSASLESLAAASAAGGGRPQATLAVATASPAHWAPGRPRRVGQIPAPPERALATADENAGGSWRLRCVGAGTHFVSKDGTEITCLPEGALAPAWERFVISQVLPLAAAVQGLELLHASAVEIDGRAYAIVGSSGAGKTSLALRLLLRGAGWITDDVLALSAESDGLRAHAGAAIAGVRHAEAERLTVAERAILGVPLGDNPKEVLLRVKPTRVPLPLAGVLFLARDSSSTLGFEPVRDPRPLLGSTFCSLVRTRDRLARALDLYARLSAETPLVRVHVPRRLDADGLAAVLIERLRRDGRAVAA